MGVTWAPSNTFLARFTYGGALINAVQTDPKDTKDEGISFLVTVHPLSALRFFK